MGTLYERKICENMFSFINKQGNSDQNYSNVSFITRLAKSLKPDSIKSQQALWNEAFPAFSTTEKQEGSCVPTPC